jgi:biotin operon repressor
MTGWSSVPNWVIRDAPLDNAEKLLYIALLNRANAKGESWPSLPTLASDTGLSESTVKRRLAKLEDAGLLSRVHRANADGKQINNLYKVAVWSPNQGGHSDQGGVVTVTGGGGHSDLRSTTQRSTTHRGRKPETTLPDGWSPNEKHRAYANEQRLNLEHEAGQFVAWVQSKDMRYRDWDAAFRTWLGKAKAFGRAMPPQQVRNLITDYDD